MSHQSKNFEIIIPELMRSLRGSHSQNWINKKLGYEFNKYSQWENGRNKVSWLNFLDVCLALKLPVDKIFRKNLVFEDDIKNVEKFIIHLLGSKSIKDYSSLLGYSEQVIKRVFEKKTEASLSFIFQAINKSSYDLDFFLSLFMPIEKLEPNYQNKLRLSRLIEANPWIEVIPRIVNAHIAPLTREKLISIISDRALNMNSAELDEIIDLMAELNLFSIDGDILKSVPSSFDTSKVNKKEIASFWNELSTDYVSNRFPDNEHIYWGYKLINCDDETLKKLKEAYFNFYQQIGQLIDGPSDKKLVHKNAVFINLQLHDLEKMLDINIQN